MNFLLTVPHCTDSETRRMRWMLRSENPTSCGIVRISDCTYNPCFSVRFSISASMYVHSLDYEKIIAVPVYTGHQSCNFSNYSNSFIAHCSWNCLINNFDWSTIYLVIVSGEQEEAVLLTKLINICFLIAPMNCVFLNSNLVGLGQWIKCIVDYVYIPRSKKSLKCLQRSVNENVEYFTQIIINRQTRWWENTILSGRFRWTAS